MLTWTDNGLTYWAVSDVAAADLETFAKAFREASVTYGWPANSRSGDR